VNVNRNLSPATQPFSFPNFFSGGGGGEGTTVPTSLLVDLLGEGISSAMAASPRLQIQLVQVPQNIINNSRLLAGLCG